MQEVSRDEVKRAYALATATRDFLRAGGDFDSSVARAQEIVGLLEIGEIEGHIKDEHAIRLLRYNSLRWRRDVVSFEDMGSHHGMSGLDFSYTTGNIVETAAQFGDFPSQIRDKVNSIRARLDKINNVFTPILIPGGMEREFWYNRTVRAIRPRERPIHEVYAHDVEDGNNRTVAACLEGVSSGEFYVGSLPEGVDLSDFHVREKRIHEYVE